MESPTMPFTPPGSPPPPYRSPSPSQMQRMYSRGNPIVSRPREIRRKPLPPQDDTRKYRMPTQPEDEAHELYPFSSQRHSQHRTRLPPTPEGDDTFKEVLPGPLTTADADTWKEAVACLSGRSIRRSRTVTDTSKEVVMESPDEAPSSPSSDKESTITGLGIETPSDSPPTDKAIPRSTSQDSSSSKSTKQVMWSFNGLLTSMSCSEKELALSDREIQNKTDEKRHAPAEPSEPPSYSAMLRNRNRMRRASSIGLSSARTEASSSPPPPSSPPQSANSATLPVRRADTLVLTRTLSAPEDQGSYLAMMRKRNSARASASASGMRASIGSVLS